MVYSDILGIDEDFQSFYDLTNEKGDYWKHFIPTEKFYYILNSTLNSLTGTQSQDKKSLWMQGTYGTGKSHATSVIKHLLWDDIEKIKKYVNTKINDSQIKNRLLKFREKGNKIFPIVLQGISKITNVKTFGLVIQKAVIEAFKKEEKEIPKTKTDFDKWIDFIVKNPQHSDWDKFIQNNQELKMYSVLNKDSLINRFRDRDIHILNIFEDLLSKHDFHLSPVNIKDWLTEISDEIRNNNIATSLILYWDEFTPILESSNKSEYLSELQNIAQMSIDNKIYFFVVSHRKLKIYERKIPKEELKKVEDRFSVLDYAMEDITTYHLISNAIQKKDRDKWNQLKKKHLENNVKLNNLIDRLVWNEGRKEKECIKNIFPIHPYAGHIATLMSRLFGSTNRSIFNFLNTTKNNGFTQFINKHPKNELYIFLTGDYLWDYFIEFIEDDNISEKYDMIISKYKNNIEAIRKEGKVYEAAFKIIVFLNILNNATKADETKQNELVKPSIENIKGVLLGTQFEENIDKALKFIDKNNYVQKNPDNLFLISLSSLPEKEIEKEKEFILKDMEKDLLKIFTSEQKKLIEEAFSNNILRKTEVKLYWAGERKHHITRKLDQDFKNKYSLNIAVFLALEDIEIQQIKKFIDNDILEKNYPNIIHVTVDTVLTTQDRDKYIDYYVKSRVFEKHDLNDDKIINRKHSNKIIENWITNIKNGRVELRLRNINEKCIVKNFSNLVNNKISTEIFSYGLETINNLQISTIWNIKTRSTDSYIKIFLSANSLDEVLKNTSSHPKKHLREMIRNNNGEYIINNNLNIIKNINEKHPLIKIWSEVNNRINNISGNFNLGRELRFLNQPPYGLYLNVVYEALMGFIMRVFLGKFYEAGTGKRIDKETLMLELIKTFFDYLHNNKKIDEEKLNLRLITYQEEELIEIIPKIFNISKPDSLNDLRWLIKEWITKKLGYPLWVYKKTINPSVDNAIDKIILFINSIDEELDDKKIIDLLSAVKEAKLDLRCINKAKAKTNFINWVNQIDGIKENLPNLNYDELYEYIKSNMPEEKFPWDENKAILSVYKYKADKITEIHKEKEEMVKKEQEKKEHEYLKEQEKKLIEIFASIFRIDICDNLNDLKKQLIKWTTESKYPFWVFKSSVNNENIKNIIDDINSFINSKNVTIKEYINLLEVVKETKNSLNLEKEKAQDYFFKWIKEILNTDFSSENLNEIIDFTEEKLGDKFVKCNEKDLIIEIQKWQLKKQDEKVISKTIEINQNKKIHSDKKKTVKNKIKSKNVESLRNSILLFLEENPQFCEILDKYL